LLYIAGEDNLPTPLMRNTSGQASDQPTLLPPFASPPTMDNLLVNLDNNFSKSDVMVPPRTRDKYEPTEKSDNEMHSLVMDYPQLHNNGIAFCPQCNNMCFIREKNACIQSIMP
jgi:hypothetical protein